MKKFLRISLMLILALTTGVGVAQTTITFTAGIDKGTYDNAGNGPDEISKEGITVKTTSGNSAFAAAQYRFSKSSVTTFSSSVGNITKVVFTCTASGDTKYGPGCFSSPSAGSYNFDGKIGTWTGNAAAFTLSAASNQVRATKIEVTVGGEASSVTAPTISGEDKFSESTTITITAGDGAQIYYTTNGDEPTNASTAYSAPFTITQTTTVKAIAYAGGQKSTVTSKTFTNVGNLNITGKGTQDSPYTVADALTLIIASMQDENAEVYVQGIISQIDEVSTQFGNATYYISDDGATATQLEVYRGYYLNGEKFTATDQIKVGDKVVILGKLILFNKTQTPEIGTGSKLISINSDSPVEIVDAASIAAFNSMPTGTVAKLKLTDAQVIYTWTSNNNNTEAYLRDATGTVQFYNSGLQLDFDQVLNGSVIIKRSAYNNMIQASKVEQTNANDITITEGDPAQAKRIAITEAKNNVANLVELNEVTIVTKETTNSKNETTTRYYAVTGNDSLQVYDGFHLDGFTLQAQEKAIIKGIIKQYRDTYEICPTTKITTGINGVYVNNDAADDVNAPTFNVMGQRVSRDYKGIVIRNGKKRIQQ